MSTICGYLARLCIDALAVNALLGVAFSLLVEKLPNWNEWSFEAKRTFVFVLCMAVPILALALSVAGCGMALTVDAVIAALGAGTAAFSASTLMHMATR